MNEAQLLLDYLPSLPVTQGPLAGEPFTVMPFQQRFIRRAWADDVETAGLSMARGNGKTTLLGYVADAYVRGPLARPREEVVVVASSFSQGRILFETALALGAGDYEQRSRWKINDTEQKALIEDRKTGSRLRVIGSDPRRAHGLQARLILADEPAQWGPSGPRMVAALITASGKLEGFRFIALGTRAASDDHWFSRWLSNTADYSQVHTAGEDDPPFRKTTWIKANPGLKYLPALEAAIRKNAKQAKQDPELLMSFLALRLNLGVSDVTEALLISADVWAGAEGEVPAEGRYIMGVDLGGSAAMSAVAGYWPDTGRLEVIAAFPGDPGLDKRSVADGVPGLYQRMQVDGDLLVAESSKTVPVPFLLDAALERWGAPALVVTDRWREAELVDGLRASGVPKCGMELRGQGFKDGGEDVRMFRRGVLEGRVTPKPSLVLRTGMAEARTVVDPAGNTKLAVRTEGGRRLASRDDAAAAAVLAVSASERRREVEHAKPSGSGMASAKRR